MEGFGMAVFALLVGCFITWGVTSDNVHADSDARWQIEAAGHGYAHFNPDRSWHWNNEVAK